MIVLLLAALCATTPVATEGQTFDIAGRTVQVEADTVTADTPARRIYLIGNAILRLGETTFRADRIVIDLTVMDAPSVVASGRAVIQDPDRGRIEGDQLRYDFKREVGELADIHAELPLGLDPPLSDLMRPEEQPSTLFIDADRAVRQGGNLTIEGASVTTSPSDPPQFRIRAGRVEVRTGGQGTLEGVQSLVASSVEFRLYEFPLLHLSRVSLGRQSLFMPRVGTNGLDGLYLEYPFSFGLAGPLRIAGAPRLGTGSLFTGHLRLQLDTGVGTVDVIGSERERHLLLVSPGEIQVSRIPEFLYNAPTWRVPGLGGHVSTFATFGQYDEEGNRTAWRQAAEVSYDQPLHIGATSRASLGLAGRWAHYGTGQNYGWLRGEAYFEKAFDYRVYVGLGLTSHLVTGSTPFRFDRIEIPTQFTTDTRVRLTDNVFLRNEMLIDLNHRELQRALYGVAWRDRLLEYGVNVITDPTLEVQFNARVVGF